MAQIQSNLLSSRKKTKGTRSRTGCRTCRIRRIKCDESPGQCNNCISANWKCDGYDTHRLPRRTDSGLRDMGTRTGWSMTADEHRCFSYFQFHSIANLTGFFDSKLWQQLVLQMSHADPAVFHAVTMLSAAHQESEAHGMQISEGTHHRSRGYYFSLQESTRAVALLNRRRTSQDPQLRQTILVCCLLFVLSEVLLGHWDLAFTHLRSGLYILRELEAHKQLESEIEPSLVVVFRRLDMQSSLYGAGGPILSLKYDSSRQLFRPSFEGFTSFEQIRNELANLVEYGVPLFAGIRCLSSLDAEAASESLYLEQGRLLGSFAQFAEHLKLFCERHYHKLSEKDRKGLDIIELVYCGHILALKILFLDGPVPKHFIPDFLVVLQAHERKIDELRRRSGLVMHHVIIANVYLVATRCPDPWIRLRAIYLLRSWPHFEGLHSSIVAALMAFQAFKRDFPDYETANSMVRMTKKDEQFMFESIKSMKKGAIQSVVPIVKMAGRLYGCK
ncbi:C6 zinc finger domain protein [Aspergillus sclerotioniger CBS 115572]|uniref:C6 zinc finger domain protein n=1 Tax=Aspergillus sclerotioniger CBS 115572 TaxID=1450535 RepID=A0A317WV65_9EURO|nr:C6 zinc finger domain protein [Aspergillus sclerotioniger CBS 115572]PWY90314.1 C6 zinc finger domain protein [Aspergillus sclerotioniger CBS 115572]